MKIQKILTSMTLAASIAANQVMLTDWGITAHAATTPSREIIANDIFGIKNNQFTNIVPYAASGYNGSNIESVIIIDPRITGTVEISKINDPNNNHNYVNLTKYTYGSAWPTLGSGHTTSSVYKNLGQPSTCTIHGYSVSKENMSSKYGYQYMITYTPSSEDIANKVAILKQYSDVKSYSDSTKQSMANVTNSDMNSGWYQTLQAGVSVSIECAPARTGPYVNTGIMCGDLVTYASTGVWTQDPTSKFASASVNKTYLDSDFSAGFTTDSDGAVTYTSSAPGVATIGTNGQIHIAGAGETTITAKTAATSAYNESTTTMKLTVGKATPTLSGISATKIEYKQTLASSTVSGTATVGSTVIGGTWSWQNSSIAPAAGTSTYDITFTPNDTNVNPASGKCSLVIDKSTNYTVTPTATSITYGNKLSSSALNKTSSITGNIAWTSPDTVPNAGTYPGAWKFTPNDLSYEPKTGTVNVTVNQAPLTVNITNIAAITYGQQLSSAIVTGTAMHGSTPVSGHFAWQNDSVKPSVTDSNTTVYTLQFIPDSSNYQTFTTTRTITVNRAAAITNPASISLSATPITFEQSLSASTISTTSPLPVTGHFEWENPSEKPSAADSGKAYAVKFIPTDTTNYEVIHNLSCAITVNKATPNMTGITVTGTGIIYEQTLADSVISGNTPVAGHYEWVTPNTKPSVTDSNTTLYDIVFIPNNEVDYNRVTVKTSISVAKATPSITESMKLSVSASGITYGDTLASSTLSGTTPVTGRYVWDNTSIQPSVADSDRTAYNVTFIPDDTANYNPVSGLTCTVNVAKATVNVSDDVQLTIHASAITYGQSLRESTLDGTTPVPGRYVWDDNTITPSVPDSNVTEYNVTFVPDDLDNYNLTTGLKCKLTVNKATPDLTGYAISGTEITYGDTLAASTLSGDAPVPGHYKWSDSSIAPSVSDSNTTNYSVVFVPDDDTNYTTASTTITIKINPLTPVVTPAMQQSITASSVVYGQTLVDSTLTGDVPIPGHYEWAEPSTKPSVSDSNVTVYDVVFVPDDSTNYTTATGMTAMLEIIKATPVISSSIKATLKASAITYGQTLNNSVISGDVPLAGHWEWQDPDVTPTTSDSNTTEYVLTFVPHDTNNYNTASTTLKLPVERAMPHFTSGMVTASDIAYGNSLADSTLSTQLPKFNGTDITGSFAWEDASIGPDAGEREYNVIFTPDDNDNFTTATIPVSIVVHQIEPVITNEMLSTITASDITYGQSLAVSTLTGDTPMSGHYEWLDNAISPTVADSKATAYQVVFKPDDPNYCDVTVSVTVKVNKAIPVISADILDTIVSSSLDYGQKLSESILSGETPAAGKYVWKNGDITPSVNDDNNFMVTFIPSDLVNYEPVDIGNVHVTVSKSDPQLTEQDWLAIRSSWIVYGQSLADSPIYNDSSIPGSIAWVDPSIKPSVADSQRSEYDALFIPDDADNYNMVRLKLKITVRKAVPSLPENILDSLTIQPIQCGMMLRDSAITCSDTNILPGKFTWTDDTIKPTISDSDATSYDITFTPDDTLNYEIISLASTIHVDKRDINPDDPDNPVNPVINTKDSISVKSGAEVTYDISKSVRIKDYTAAIKTISDPNSIIDGIITIKDDTVSFKVKTGVAQSSADLVFTITSDTYKDFNFTLAVVVDECIHNGDTHLRGKIDPTWDEPGYTGDLICDTCGVTLKYGEAIPALKTECKHTKTHVENYKAATTTEPGYTGDIVCNDCGVVVRYGSVIPVVEECKHSHTHVENKVDATCQSEGYTGDTICDDCGTVVTKGTVQAKISHIEGSPVVVKAATRTETGLRAWYCTMCNTELRTEVIPKLSSGGGSSVRPSRPIRPADPADDPTDPVNPDKPDPDTPDKPDKPDPDKPDAPITEEPTGPSTDEPDVDEPTSETDEPSEPTDEPTSDSDEPDAPTDEPTNDSDESGESTSDSDEPGNSDEPTSDSDEPSESGDSKDTSVSDDSKDTDNSDDSKSDAASDPEDSNSNSIPDNGIIKQVGIADGVYEHTPDDGHAHHFAHWVIKSGNPYPVYDHICEDCGLIEEVASDTDPNTWGTDSDNPYTGVDTMPVAASGLSAVIAAAITLFRRRKDN